VLGKPKVGLDVLDFIVFLVFMQPLGRPRGIVGLYP